MQEKNNDFLPQIQRKRTAPNEHHWQYEETYRDLPIKLETGAEDDQTISSKAEQYLHSPEGKRKGELQVGEASKEGVEVQCEGGGPAEDGAEEGRRQVQKQSKAGLIIFSAFMHENHYLLLS